MLCVQGRQMTTIVYRCRLRCERRMSRKRRWLWMAAAVASLTAKVSQRAGPPDGNALIQSVFVRETQSTATAAAAATAHYYIYIYYYIFFASFNSFQTIYLSIRSKQTSRAAHHRHGLHATSPLPLIRTPLTHRQSRIDTDKLCSFVAATISWKQL